MLVIPRGHKTAQVVGDMNRTLKKVREAAGALGDAEGGHVRAKSGLSEAIEGLDSEKNKAAYRVLGSTPFCVAVLMLEVWNVSSESEALKQTMREKNSARATAGIISAIVDLTIALEALTVKLLGSQPKDFISRKSLWVISEEGAERWLGKTLGEVIAKQITSRLIAQILSGSLLFTINLYDIWYAWQWNDQAIYGYLLISMGGLLSALGSIVGGLTVYFGLNPLGWAALLLIGMGVGLVIIMSSTPLESWLANGPFGESHSIDLYLQDPLEAFYRLASLLAGISISIERNPAHEQHATFDTHAKIPHAIRSADTVIRLESRLPGVIGSLHSVSIQADCRHCRILERINNQGVPYRATVEVTDKATRPNAQRLYPNAIELFFTTPTSQISSTGNSRHYYKWAVRAQFILTHGGENLYFPSPPVKDPTKYSSKWAVPNFEVINQPFWADEITHKVSLND
ncbi:Uncharacterized protein ALO79_01089 [Pseudomonas syringae pv. castaneae]|uniref:Uncharacterized protein n=1 Tax=Pseudomonas syringae pv. castaneae TaxID=264450 RepID=A0A0P9MST6_PSESX|nr:Uncharacterized protein ALO79_01089 [Pseudomonas syringae pv. castaneae]